MAKEKAKPQSAESPMTLEQSKAYRASLYKPAAKVLSPDQKREAFRVFWVANKRKFGDPKNIEKALWMHLKTIGMDSPEKFAEGLRHFGLKVK